MPQQQPPKRRAPTWLIITVSGIVGLCCVGVAISAALPKDAKNDAGSVTSQQPQDSAAASVAVTTTTKAATPPVQPVKVDGTGNEVKDIGATLNGRFKVDYSAEDSFLIVDFLKADGSDGAGLFDAINEGTGSGNVSGSKVVSLTNVTMVQTQNTEGNWSLTFTALG